jgi:hypothetical protein
VWLAVVTCSRGVPTQIRNWRADAGFARLPDENVALSPLRERANEKKAAHEQATARRLGASA